MMVSDDQRPIFLCETGRRARVLHAGIRAATALTAVWLLALVAGGVGFARLPAWRAGRPATPVLAVSTPRFEVAAHRSTRGRRAQLPHRARKRTVAIRRLAAAPTHPTAPRADGAV